MALPTWTEEKKEIVIPKSKTLTKEDYRRDNARKTNHKNNPNGYLYILYYEYLDLFKVGVSNNPKRRIRDIKAHSPFDLKPIFIKNYEDVYKLEKMVHNRWNHNRIKGEWFQGYKEDIEDMIKLLNEIS